MFGGGKGMGGGSVLRVVSRSVARASVPNLQEPISSPSPCTSTSVNSRPSNKLNSTNNSSNSSNTNHNNISLSSSGCGSPPYPACGVPLSAAANFGGPTHTTTTRPSLGGGGGGGDEWVSVDGSDGEIEKPPVGGSVLGPVPSKDEVHDAVSALTEVFDTAPHTQLVRDKFAYDVDKDVGNQISSPNQHGVLSTNSESNWIEPSPCPRMVQRYGCDKVYDAFHLLQTDPSVQKIVISLSSDKAVWDAVLNNEAVQELRETYQADESTVVTPEGLRKTGSDSNPAVDFVKWIFDNTKARVMEVFEKVTKLVNELFKPSGDEKAPAGVAGPFEDKLRTSFMLSVVVLLVVVVSRAQKA